MNRSSQECWNQEVIKSPLHARAWVLQETFLSPRILRFGATQILWECWQVQASEMDPDGDDIVRWLTYGEMLSEEYHFKQVLSRLLDKEEDITKEADVDEWTGEVARKNLERQLKIVKDLNLAVNVVAGISFPLDERGTWQDYWFVIVQKYMACGITKGSDRLVALSGLATHIARHTGFRYLAGLWYEHLVKGLMWSVENPLSRPKDYRAPSWSWASVDGEIVAFPRGSVFQTVIEAVEVTPQYPVSAPFGQVIKGSLTIHAWLAVVDWVKDDDDEHPDEQSYPPTIYLFDSQSGSRDIEANASMFEPDVLFEVPQSKQLICLFLFMSGMKKKRAMAGGLVLEPIEEKQDTYRRIGVFGGWKLERSQPNLYKRVVII
jgi:hypothetical protein